MKRLSVLNFTQKKAMIKTICFIFAPFLLCAQTISSFIHWHNDAAFSLTQQSILADDITFIGGVFRSAFVGSADTLSSIGGTDILLALADENGQAIWAASGGSERNDELVEVANVDDRLYATGTYWLESTFGDIQLETVGSPQGIFLLQYNTEGEAIWGISINGSGDKEIHDLAVDRAGNLLLTGSFRGELWVNEDTLRAENSTLFLLKLNAQGQTIWTHQTQTFAGRASGIALSILPDNQIIVLGEYVGETAFGEILLATDTQDEDIFLATYHENGTLLWVREAGGVFPSFAVDLVQIDDQIIATGNFVGRIELSSDLIIQSAGVNEDIFLLAYDLDGVALWARTIGGAEVENVRSLASNGKNLLLGGFFRNNFQSEAISLTANSDQETAFVLQTDSNGTPQWGQVFPSSEQSYVNDIQWRNDERWQAIGDFQGTITSFDNIDFEAFTLNGFIAIIEDQPTSTVQSKADSTLFNFYQTTHFLQLQNAHALANWELFDLQGRLIKQAVKTQQLFISDLPTGIYIVRICDGNKSCQTTSFFKL